jgi:hypothetical protein
MRKYLIRQFLKSFFVFLILLIFCYLSFNFWSKKIEAQIKEIDNLKNQNQRNQDIISNYNNLLNERQFALEKIKKLEDLFFSKDDALLFKDKIKSFMIVFDLLGDVNYTFSENENEIKFVITIDSKDFKQKIQNIEKFLNSIQKKKLVNIEGLKYDGNFQIIGTVYLK